MKQIILGLPVTTTPPTLKPVNVYRVSERKKLKVLNCGYINQYRAATLGLLQNQAY